MKSTILARVGVALVIVALLIAGASPSEAGGRGSGWSGGSHAGSGMSGHSGHGHGHFHGHGFVGGGVFVGGGPWGWDPFWYSPWPWPYPSAPPPVYGAQSWTYVERPLVAGYWYYCPSANAYYPSVPSCPEPWVPVAPRQP
jgi:hypothetical protein